MRQMDMGVTNSMVSECADSGGAIAQPPTQCLSVKLLIRVDGYDGSRTTGSSTP